MPRLTPTLSLLMTIALSAVPLAAQDAERGEDLFKKCKSCHMVGDGAKNKNGPVLTGVVGRKAGTYPGYKYGASMKAAGAAGLVWGEPEIVAYIADPKRFLRTFLGDKSAKAKMSFRLKNETNRRDVVAFLASFSGPGDDMQATLQTCVLNSTSHSHFFVAEAPDGTRQTAQLAPGASLCTSGGTAGHRAVVSVFEHAEAFEGCSRLVAGGATETLFKYVDFDRCVWASNS